ncbi:MAG TPA: hypothetical protein VGQ22_15025 [Steroidobacteraceae bacterium]|jgi:nicotinic acid phosphoribosyltransferase|nr:hypothetical protein [Steroidobacteraceae bacterium]
MSSPQANAFAPALLTDLYQLTMLDAYYTLGMEKPAVFARTAPKQLATVESSRRFGIPAAGTMAASQDAPSLDCAYKLQQYAGRMCRKRSQMSTALSLTEVRTYCAEQLATLPTGLNTLEHVTYTPAKVSDKQHALVAELDLVAH